MTEIEETRQDDSMDVDVAPVEKPQILMDDLKQNIQLLEKAVNLLETRFITRVMRSVPSMRKQLTSKFLISAIKRFYPEDHARGAKLLDFLGSSFEQASMEEDNSKSSASIVIPETELYISLLCQVYLLDTNELKKGTQLSIDLVKCIHEVNRRTADKLAARIYFYYARFYELQGELASIRPELHAAHRSAALRHDNESQATLSNILVRNYFLSNLHEQAHKLLSKTTFPESVSNNQFVRHMYYLGRIDALQLNYTSAHQHLLQAVRKAPQNVAAAGFLQAIHKLALIVQLLMGDLPDRATFRLPMLRLPLIPYLHITQAVRVGDLTKFQATLAQYRQQFLDDNNYNLILRLRHNVIKTGVRMISLSYSKISLRDICFKLQLDSEQDAEYIVAKAIRDGVIDAEINHQHGYIQSKENVDIYSTAEPMDAFHQRITFCLNLHNDSVKAMRFPMNFHHPELEFAEEARERERELVKEINEADMDDDSNMEY